MDDQWRTDIADIENKLRVIKSLLAAGAIIQAMDGIERLIQSLPKGERHGGPNGRTRH